MIHLWLLSALEKKKKWYMDWLSMLSHSLDNHLVPKTSPLPSMQVDKDGVVLLEIPGGTTPSIPNVLMSVVWPEVRKRIRCPFMNTQKCYHWPLNCESSFFVWYILYQYTVIQHPTLLQMENSATRFSFNNNTYGGSTSMFFCFSYIKIYPNVFWHPYNHW